jgi:hypothetical protein
LGLLPFVCLALAGPFLDSGLRARAAFALAAYGATIVSFLGGVHWGLAMGSAHAAATKDAMSRRLCLSIVPPLAAWAALLLSTPVSLFALAAAIVAMLWVDIRDARSGDAPAWYPNLRWPLSCAAAATLLLGGLL